MFINMLGEHTTLTDIHAWIIKSSNISVLVPEYSNIDILKTYSMINVMGTLKQYIPSTLGIFNSI